MRDTQLKKESTNLNVSMTTWNLAAICFECNQNRNRNDSSKIDCNENGKQICGIFFEFALVSSWFLDGDLVGTVQQANRRID
jgi:hypothetical protein